MDGTNQKYYLDKEKLAQAKAPLKFRSKKFFSECLSD